MGACGQLQTAWDGKKLIWIKINLTRMATVCKFTTIWRLNLFGGSLDLIHKLEPVLWEKMSVIRRSREDFVYLVCFQYRHHCMNWYNLWWMQAGLSFVLPEAWCWAPQPAACLYWGCAASLTPVTAVCQIPSTENSAGCWASCQLNGDREILL